MGGSPPPSPLAPGIPPRTGGLASRTGDSRPPCPPAAPPLLP
jgi:hypothetical protein